MLAYCLMGNHYHFVLHTRSANLSLLMRHINGVYSQRYNRRHGLVGHLLQGRLKAVLVDRDAYLLEVCRYVELNPVRAAMMDGQADWSWSSYRSHVGLADGPAWLDTPGLHGYLLGRDAQTAADARRAGRQYAQLVAAGRDVRLWGDALWMAHTRSGLRMTAMAAELGLSVARVSQLIAKVQADRRRGG